MHSHRCGRCGQTWSHGRCAAGDVHAHSCHGCGAGPWWDVLGPGDLTFREALAVLAAATLVIWAF